MLILPHPRKLWTPRLPFAIWDKAGGGIVDGAAGIVDCADCPCDDCTCDSATQCTHCTDCTPDTIRVVISGVTSCCSQAAGTSNRVVFDLGNLNGSHDLTQDGDCKWSASVTRFATGQDYDLWTSSTDCDGAADSTTTAPDGWGFTIWLDRTAANWELEIIGSLAPGAEDLVFFKGSIAETADGDCNKIDTIDNDYVVGDCNDTANQGLTNGNPGLSDLVTAYGGSARFTICP